MWILKSLGSLLDQGITSIKLSLFLASVFDKTSIKYTKYFSTIKPLAFEVSMILYIKALAFAPFAELEKSQFLRLCT